MLDIYNKYTFMIFFLDFVALLLRLLRETEREVFVNNFHPVLEHSENQKTYHVRLKVEQPEWSDSEAEDKHPVKQVADVLEKLFHCVSISYVGFLNILCTIG